MCIRDREKRNKTQFLPVRNPAAIMVAFRPFRFRLRGGTGKARQLVFNRVGDKVFLYHQRHLKHNGVVEFPQIQAGEALDLLQPVDQRCLLYTSVRVAQAPFDPILLKLLWINPVILSELLA